MFLWHADGRCPLSNKQAGSLQMGPRWWHYLSSAWSQGGVLGEGGSQAWSAKCSMESVAKAGGMVQQGSELLACDKFGQICHHCPDPGT